MDDKKIIKSVLREEAEKELIKNILRFWAEKVIDIENGGFLGYIDNNLNIDKTAPKSAVLNTRILWTYSKAYNMLKNDEYLILASRAYEYIKNFLWDHEYEGLFWMVDYKGNPINTKKQIYAQAFGIYALSEYYIATKNQESLDYAIKLYELIERHSYDNCNKGYFEACSRNWEATNDLKLGEEDMNEKKSMNTHLHILEAYTNLFRVWENGDLRLKFKELIEVIMDYIIDNKTYHFKLFFDEFWNSKSEKISYGHDIEGSWLLVEAAQILGDKNLLERTKEISICMAQKVYQEGIDSDGAVINEMNEKGDLDKDRIWWVQAEAVVGFLNAYDITRKEYFLEAAKKTWEFIKEYVIDREYGEWFWNISKKGKVDNNKPKVDSWKCPYHNSRSCFEVIQRISTI